MSNIIGLLPCAGTASRLYNIPKFILPLKDKNYSLLTNWCKILFNYCNEIIIGSSPSNKPFIEHILKTQLDENEINKIIIKVIENSQTMNNTIIEMLRNEIYDIAIMGMPDTHIDYLSPNLINRIIEDDKHIIGAYLWNLRKSQIGKIGQCKIENNYICEIIDKNKNCEYKYGWGCMVFKPSFEVYIDKNDLHLGYSMSSFIKDKKEIIYEIIRGQYWDCGTIDEYKDYMNFMNLYNPIFIKGTLIIIDSDININEELNELRNIYNTETIVYINKNNIDLNINKNLHIYILNIKNSDELYNYFRADTYIKITNLKQFLFLYDTNKKNLEEPLKNDNPEFYNYDPMYSYYNDTYLLKFLNKK